MEYASRRQTATKYSRENNEDDDHDDNDGNVSRPPSDVPSTIHTLVTSTMVIRSSTITLVALLYAKTTYASSSSWYDNVTFSIHRNGSPDPCGSTSRIDTKFIEAVSSAADKYEIESILTDQIAGMLTEPTSCGSTEMYAGLNMEARQSLYGHCDMGPQRTPILLDHDDLVPTNNGKPLTYTQAEIESGDITTSLPCRWYTREGLRIASIDQLESLAKNVADSNVPMSPSCANPQEGEDGTMCAETTEIHLYAVQAGRPFMFAPAYVGEEFRLDHLKLLPEKDKPIIMKVLSVEPRVFDILHVFTPAEAQEVVEKALAETSPTHQMQRSTTGAKQKTTYSRRTSENAWMTHKQVAVTIKKRIFELLGYDEFLDGHDDGLQVLRYNETNAYIPHQDYLVDRDTRGTKDTYDYDSARKGGNRFATVLLYMSDIPEGGGGETVFAEAYPPELDESEHQSLEEALTLLRATGDAARSGIEEGSWEEEMVATCRSKLAVRPHAGRAVLFYSQHPNGQEDTNARHGGCPVLGGHTKWAANLWVWNAPRASYKGAPLKEGAVADSTPSGNVPQSLLATFRNSGDDPSMNDAVLFYDEAQYWGKLGPNDPVMRANTYEGHRWTVKVGEKIVETWVIGKDAEQEFVL